LNIAKKKSYNKAIMLASKLAGQIFRCPFCALRYACTKSSTPNLPHMVALYFKIMNENIELEIEVGKYSLRIAEKPMHWANGIYVQIFTNQGERINAISYAAHPEFEDFDLYKNMTVDELVEVALSRIEKDIKSKDFNLGAENGIELLLPINKKI